VGLAYKVLLGWFAICPLSDRGTFFKNITRTLMQLVRERNDAKAEAYFDLALTLAFGELPPFPPVSLEFPPGFAENSISKYWIQGPSSIPSFHPSSFTHMHTHTHRQLSREHSHGSKGPCPPLRPPPILLDHLVNQHPPNPLLPVSAARILSLLCFFFFIQLIISLLTKAV
jgi:hypothetical protein